MTIETRPRAPRPGEDKRRTYTVSRVRWRLGGGTGAKQSLTLDDPSDAARLEAAVKAHGYPSARDPFVRSLAIIGANGGTVAAPAPTALTLADALTAYAARPDVAANTRKNLKGAAARFPDHLTRRNIHTITADHLTPVLAEIAADYAPSTVYQTRMMLRSVLTLHGRADVAPKRVAASRTVEPRYLTRIELETLAVAADKHGLGAMVRLVGQTGLRWAEAVALEARHVDRNRRVIMVRGQLPQKGMTTWAPGKPKSERSRRDVPLTAASLKVIDDHLAANPPVGPAMFAPTPGAPGKRGTQNHNGRGGPRQNAWWSYGTFWLRWQAVVEDAGLGPVRFHDLRHSAAKQMLDNGVRLDVVSKILGHANVLITASIYGGIDDVSYDLARAAFE